MIIQKEWGTRRGHRSAAEGSVLERYILVLNKQEAMHYLERTRELKARTSELLDEANHVLSELYVKKAQVDELRSIDDEYARGRSQSIRDIPEEDIDEVKQQRETLREIFTELSSVEPKLVTLAETLSGNDVSLTKQRSDELGLDELEPALDDVEVRLDWAEARITNTPTLSISDMNVSIGGESTERDLIKEMLLESKAHALYDDTRLAFQFLAATDDYPSWKTDLLEDDLSDPDAPGISAEDVNDKLLSADGLNSHALQAIVSKADNLLKSRERSASACLNRAESLKQFLTRVDNDRGDVELSAALAELSTTVAKIKASKANSGVVNNDNLQQTIEDTVFLIKDVSRSELAI